MEERLGSSKLPFQQLFKSKFANLILPFRNTSPVRVRSKLRELIEQSFSGVK